MKSVNFILVIVMIVITAEITAQQAVNNDLITVDVRKTYPQKKELILQDFMDVEYIPLETTDKFIHQGFVQDIGKKIIIVTNYSVKNGDIFIYSRTGKAIRKINRKGQGGEEYTDFFSITLDENNNEMFVNDTNKKIILVYDLNGKFIRSFKHIENTKDTYWTEIFNYDKDNLICYDHFNEKNRAFVIVSKKDGSVTNQIKIPYKESIEITHTSEPKRVPSVDPVTGQNKVTVTQTSTTPSAYRTIIPFKEDWTLLELWSDTIYTLLQNYKLNPRIVRTPSINSMTPKVFLLLGLCTDRYFFMETMKNEYDSKAGTQFPRISFMYDRHEKAFFSYVVYNGDYLFKKEMYMSFMPIGQEIESCQSLGAHWLVDFYKKGQLKGKLKEIASKLDEEDNAVIMLMKHKK